MSFKKFWKVFKSKKFKDSTELIIHFRIGTSGRKTHPDCTHPFPVSEDFKDMTLTEYKSDNVIMHNGVIGFGLGNASDTMVTIRDYIDPMYPYMNDNKIMIILKEILEDDKSRWLLAKKDTVTLLGKWHEQDGVSYSNLGYKPIVKRTVKRVQDAWHHNSHNRRYNAYGIETDYDWMPKELEKIYTIYDFKHYAISGVWQWGLFEKYLIERGKQQTEASSSYTEQGTDDGSAARQQSGDINHKDADDIYEVFNHDGKIVAAIDDSGDIIWEEPEYLKARADKTIKPCPNCPEEKNIVESPYSCGDNMCCRCGAVYINGLQGTEAILMWEMDIRRLYQKTLSITEGRD